MYGDWIEHLFKKSDDLTLTTEIERHMKKVSFDGKNIVFEVDDITITNGEFPSSLEIKESYEIDNKSLAKLVAACNNDISLMDSPCTLRYGCKLYTNNKSIKEMAERIKVKNEENRILSEENKGLLEENRMLSREKLDIEAIIERFNKQSWITKAKGILYTKKEG